MNGEAVSFLVDPAMGGGSRLAAGGRDDLWWPMICDRRPHHAHPCDRCRRLAAIGVIVEVTMQTYHPQVEAASAVLDAVADLLTDRARLAAAHRKELNDTIRDGQREARDSFAEGEARGREAGGDW